MEKPFYVNVEKLRLRNQWFLLTFTWSLNMSKKSILKYIFNTYIFFLVFSIFNTVHLGLSLNLLYKLRTNILIVNGSWDHFGSTSSTEKTKHLNCKSISIFQVSIPIKVSNVKIHSIRCGNTSLIAVKVIYLGIKTKMNCPGIVCIVVNSER